MIWPGQVEPTLEALFALGYTVHHQTPPAAGNWHMDLKRPGDVGMIDLHRAPPGPAFFYRASADVKQHCKITHVGRGSAYIPSATYRALILTIHDQFQDSDYWIGNIDMRHLLDLRDLALSPEGIDWTLLASFTPNKLARNALETHLVALFSLLAVDVPAPMRTRFIPRLQHRRRWPRRDCRYCVRRCCPSLYWITEIIARGSARRLSATANGRSRNEIPWASCCRYLASVARARSSLEVLRPEEGSKENCFSIHLRRSGRSAELVALRSLPHVPVRPGQHSRAPTAGAQGAVRNPLHSETVAKSHRGAFGRNIVCCY
jgi:hypothetical protein